MRKWYVPLAVVGVGGLGLLALAVGGRPARQWVLQKLHRAPQAFQQWNDAAQSELERLRSALDGVSASVEGRKRGGPGSLPVM